MLKTKEQAVRIWFALTGQAVISKSTLLEVMGEETPLNGEYGKE